MKKNSKFLIFNMILLTGAFISASLLSPHVDVRVYADQKDESYAKHKHLKGKDDCCPERLWCKEHNVYEDECTICRPESGAKAEKTGHDPKRFVV